MPLRRRADPRAVQPATGRDLTAAMAPFSDDFLARVEPVEGERRLTNFRIRHHFLTKLFTLARSARRPSHVNAVMHAFGYVQDGLGRAEKEHFLDLLGEYPLRRVPLFTLLHALKSCIARFDEDYLRKRLYFEPYPRELIDLSDSGHSTF